MSAGPGPLAGGKLGDVHSGSGTLRGGGVCKIYGNMASFKQYKRKIDYRLPLVTIVCISSIASILFVYGLYQLKGHDAVVDYVKNTRDIVHFLSRQKRQDPIAESFVPPDAAPIDVDSEAIEKPNGEETVIENHEMEKEKQKVKEDITEGSPAEKQTTSSTTTTTSEPVISSNTTQTFIEVIKQENTSKNNLTVDELNEMYNDFNSTYITIWNLFAVNLIVLLFLVPATVIFHFDFLGINRYKTIFRFIVILTMLFLIVQLLYLISPILTCSCSFPGYIDRLFAEETYPKTERGITELKDLFACDFETHQLLVDRGLQDPCIPKIKDSLFPCYATVLLIVLDILPFIFAFFTYAWDAWIKDCTAVREARMRVELNNQRRPRTREQIIQEQTQVYNEPNDDIPSNTNNVYPRGNELQFR